ncbi:MAG: insulinase family protein [Thermoplasmata archaeon]|nr:insulinase family protein [Thermoplasmata archaeon]
MPRVSAFAPPTERFRLRNGLNVVLAPEPASPTASVWVWYNVGSKNEWPGITGASHWVEHMLFEGSPKYRKGAIDRLVTEVGGTLNAFTEYDFTAYFTTVLKAHLDLPLDIESDRMTRAFLTDEEVERERVVILSEREGNENWPEFLAEEELFKLAYRQHPYRWDPLGRPEDIRAMTPAMLAEYYHRFYGTRNATLVVSGAFDPPSTRATIRARFGRLPLSGESPTVLEVEPNQRGERRALLRGPGTTPLVAVGWRAPAWSDAATPAALVIDVLLGGASRLFSGGFGFGRGAEHPASRLYRRLVEPGLAVRANSEYRPKAHPGLFLVSAQAVRGVPAERVETALLEEVDRLAQHGPTAAELREARAKLLRGASLSYEGATVVGFRLGFFSTVGPPRFEDRLLRAMLAVSSAEIQRTAQEIFLPERRNSVVYEPSEGASRA